MTTPMNPEVKAKWVAALRSGEYTQTTGDLQRVSSDGGDALGFCCLGVLCDIAVKDGVIAPPVVIHNLARYGSMSERCGDCLPGSATQLPTEVMLWAGLGNPAGWRQPPPRGAYKKSLIELNDSGEADFGMIADIIEEEF